MASKIPYLAQPSVINKILPKAKEASTPDRFTYDFLETKLACKGGNCRQFVSLAKKLSLLNSDGTPTDLYKKFRNNATSKAAIAQAIKIGYRELFERNEYAETLNREDLKGLIVQVTGFQSNDTKVQLILQTIENLKSFADFSKVITKDTIKDLPTESSEDSISQELHDFDLRLSYTINLVLPKTDDPAVFNAIFKSLRENLLRK